MKHFSENSQKPPTPATFERETDSNAATDDDTASKKTEDSRKPADFDPFAEEPDNPDTSPQVAQSRDGPQDKLESKCEFCGHPVTLTPYDGKNEGWHYYECAHCGECKTVQAPTQNK
jgi:hypothetical protein